MDEVDKIYSKLQGIESSFGIFGVVLALILGGFIWAIFNYFSKLVEKLAEESSEKSLKKYQANLDKGLAEFSAKATTRQQKQVDAIQEVYSRFQSLKMLIDFMVKGDKYHEGSDGHDEADMLIERRNSFKTRFNHSRILFTKELGEKVDALILSVEDFIDVYRNGLMPRRSAEQIEYEKEQRGEEDSLTGEPYLYMAGIWRQDAFDDILNTFEQISSEIEAEFRKIHGI